MESYSVTLRFVRQHWAVYWDVDRQLRNSLGLVPDAIGGSTGRTQHPTLRTNRPHSATFILASLNLPFSICLCAYFRLQVIGWQIAPSLQTLTDAGSQLIFSFSSGAANRSARIAASAGESSAQPPRDQWPASFHCCRLAVFHVWKVQICLLLPLASMHTPITYSI